MSHFGAFNLKFYFNPYGCRFAGIPYQKLKKEKIIFKKVQGLFCGRRRHTNKYLRF